MKAEQTRWARRYQAALRRHLKQGPKSSPRSALELGRQAAALGLEPLDVAQIHEKALATLELFSRRPGLLNRAEQFFADAITPIERTHRAAIRAGRHVTQLTATLGRRTSVLVASKQRLKLRIAQRRGAEEALERSREHYAKLLRESHHLQKHLRELTRRILSAQEYERKTVSRELHDEIAQTLLGIHVRLVTLRAGAANNARGLKKRGCFYTTTGE